MMCNLIEERDRLLSPIDRVSEIIFGLIMAGLPGGIAAITGPEEIEGMRRRLLDLPLSDRHGLDRGDYLPRSEFSCWSSSPRFLSLFRSC